MNCTINYSNKYKHRLEYFLQIPARIDLLNTIMDDNFVDRKLDEKWLDLGSIFEGVTNQTNDVQHLNSVGSNQEVSPGYTGDLSSVNAKDLIKENEINAWQKTQDFSN